MSSTRSIFQFKLKQLREESESWKRCLAFIAEENIYLKNRLSEAVKNSTEMNVFGDMENFLNRSIYQDNVVSLLRHDVTQFDKLLLREIYEDGKRGKILDPLVKNRENMKKALDSFEILKSEFNNYLQENIPNGSVTP